MGILSRWRAQIDEQHAFDQASEQKHGIPSGEKNWVTPADIQRLEEQMVPWLRKKRRR